MQIHEITQRRVDEGVGSFVKGLVNPQVQRQIKQKQLDKQAAKAAGKLTAQGYGASAQPASDNWEDKYKTLQNNTAVAGYAKNLAAGWAKHAGTVAAPTVGLASTTTLQKTIPSLVTAAKKTNNNLTSTQIGQLLAQSAPTVWKNTPDKPVAIKQLAAELIKQGVTVDGNPVPATKTAPGAPYDPAKAAADKLAKGQADQNATIQALKARQLGQFAPVPATASATAPVGKPAQVAPTATTAPAGVRARYPKAPTPGAISEPVFLGGKKLDPKKPNDAKIIQALQKQGKLHEAVITGPAADQYRATFVNWSDGQLATRVPETGATVTMNDVRRVPGLDTKLSAALDQVVQTQGTPQQAQAVEEYIKLAVAGVQALAQKSKNKVSASAQQQNVQFANTSGDVKQSLRSAGIDPDKLAQFGAQAKASGNPMTARRTDNQTLNTMARLAGFTLT